MSRVVARVPPVATTTSTLTLLQIIGATGRSIKPTELSISLDGITAAAVPIEFQLLEQTTAGTASAGTVVRASPLASFTIGSTSGITFTAEPTPGDIVKSWFIHPQGGSIVYTFPDPDLYESALAGRWGVRCISPGATVNAIIVIEFEE